MNSSSISRSISLFVILLLTTAAAFAQGPACGSFTLSAGSVTSPNSSGGSVLFQIESEPPDDAAVDAAPPVPLGQAYAVTNPTEGTVTVYRVDDVTGTLYDPQSYTTSGRPMGIAAADFDGNGFNDIAVTLENSDSIAVFKTVLSYGDPNFFNGYSTYPAGDQPRSIAAGDFDGNYGPDLVASNFGSSSAHVYMNDGSGSFYASTVPTAEGPWGVVAGDLNGDGDTDFAIANHGNNTTGTTVSIFLANNSAPADVSVATAAPTTTFVRTNFSSSGNKPRTLVLGDFDADGYRDDLVVGNFASNNVSVFFNNGAAVFAPPTAPAVFAVGGSPVGLASTNFDNANGDDIVVVTESVKQARVLLNDGAGHFAATSPISYALGVTPSSVVAGNLNGGPRDFIVAGAATPAVPNLRVYLQGVRASLIDFSADDNEVDYFAPVNLFVRINDDATGPFSIKWSDNGTVVTTPLTPVLDGGDLLFTRTVNPKVTTTFKILSITGANSCALTFPSGSEPTETVIVTPGSTSVTLTMPAATAAFGNSTRLTAKINAATTPTGSVVFYINGLPGVGTAISGPVTVSSGQAILLMPSAALTGTWPLVAGSYSFSARFTGTGGFANSDSVLIPFTVTASSTSTTLASSPNPAPTGSSVTYTATVSGTAMSTGAATGTPVHFYGSLSATGPWTLLGSANVDAARKAAFAHTFTGPLAGPGTRYVMATFNDPSQPPADNPNFTTSSSAALTQTMAPGTTTALVASPLSPAAVGTSVTFTATVTNGGGPDAPTGTMRFYNGASLIGTVTTGTPSTNTTAFAFSTSSLAVGSHSIVAKFTPSGAFGPSESTALPYVIEKSDNVVVEIVDLVDPTPYGAPIFSVRVTATPATPVPSGAVNLYRCNDGSGCLNRTLVKNLQLTNSGSGYASANVSLPTLDVDANYTGIADVTNDPYWFVAVYTGNSNYESAESESEDHTVAKGDSSISIARLASSTSPAAYCDQIQFDVTLTAANGATGFPGGIVDLNSDLSGGFGGGAVNGSGNRRYTLTNLNVGTHTLTASHVGTRNWNSATPNATIGQIITASTAFFVTDSFKRTPTGDVAVGQPVTFTVRVGPLGCAPTGNVTFSGGAGEPSVTVPVLANGMATGALAFCTTGAKNVKVSFDSDDSPENFSDIADSVLAALAVNVEASDTTTTIADPGSILINVQETLTATVVGEYASGSAPNGCTPAGDVQFYDGVTAIGSPVALNGSGQASLNWTFTSNGPRTLKAVYAGNAAYNTSEGTRNVAVNEAPTITSADTETFPQGSTTTFTVTTTGYPTGAAMDITYSGTLPNGVTFTDNNDGTATISGDPTSSPATYTINITANNGVTPNATQEFDIVVTGAVTNDPPTAVADAFTVAEGGTQTVLASSATSVLANDTDPENDTLTAILVSGPSNDSAFTLNSDGTFSYTHDGSETTSDSFTYKANDGQDSNTVTVSITITPVNDAPVAVADAFTVAEGGTQTVLDSTATSVLANDTDAENDTLTAVLVSGPSNDSAFTLNSDGTFSYTHDGSETTSDSFTYKANDGQDSNTVTVSITITPVNEAPTAVADSFTVAEGDTQTVLDSTATSVLANDTDPENDTLTAVLVSGPSNESAFTLNSDGTFSYTHDGSETTSDSFTYKANDGQDSNTVTVSITITPVNDAPVAVADSLTVAEGGTQTVLDSTATSVLANDTDAENDTLTAVLVSGPSNDSAFTLNSDGTFSYTHDGSETTSDSFTYKANDGQDSNTVTVSITITPVNEAPTAVADSFTVAEGGTQTVLDSTATSVLANDTDPENDTLTAVLVSGPSNESAFTLNSDGTFSYTHDGSETTSDSFTYKANDGQDSNTVTVSITITPQNDAPTLDVTGAGTHTSGGSATTALSSATITDVDDTNIEGATVQITANMDTGDTLNFANNFGVSFVSYTGGLLTLTGSATKANYELALESVTFSTSSTSTATRTLTWQVSDGTANSTDTSTMAVQVVVNSAPSLSVSATAATYNANETADELLAAGTGATITDTDDTNMESATITITNAQSGDILTVGANPAGLTVSGNNTSSITLTGSASKADYETTLEGITFKSTAKNTSTRTISWKVNDGDADSNLPTSSRTVTYKVFYAANAVQSTPTSSVSSVTLANVNTGSGPNRMLVVGVMVGDGSTDVTSVTLNGSGTGWTKLFAQDNSSTQVELWYLLNPTETTTGSVVVTIASSKEMAAGAFTLQNVDQSTPFRNSTFTTATSSANTGSTSVTVAAGNSSADDLIVDVIGYQDNIAALAPSTGDERWDHTTADRRGAGSTRAGSASAVAVGWAHTTDNDPRVLVAASAQPNTAPSFTVVGSPTATFVPNVSAGTLLTSATITDTDSISGATISITGNHQAGSDTLNFTNQNGITGVFASGTLTLSGTTTAANYQTALASITFSSTSANADARTITWTVNDVLGAASPSRVTYTWIANTSVALDNTTTGSVGSGVVTLSHTTPATANRVLVVGVSLQNTNDLTSVTYNGVALTRLIRTVNGREAQLWYLVNPPASTTANVLVTSNTSGDDKVVGAMTLTGVNLNDPFRSNLGATGNSTSPSVTVASASGDLVVDVLAAANNAGPFTAGASQTGRWSDETQGGVEGVGSTEPGAAPSVTMSWTQDSAQWAISAGSARP